MDSCKTVSYKKPTLLSLTERMDIVFGAGNSPDIQEEGHFNYSETSIVGENELSYGDTLGDGDD